MKKIIFEGESRFSHYKVVDQIYNGRSARLLLSGNDAPQSGLALDDDPELLFDYSQRFLEVILGVRPKSVLVIGGGAFTLPKALVERFPDMRIDAVEIDPLLAQIAKEYFFLPDSPNLTIIDKDGREHISSCDKKYDCIVVDAFEEFTIPPELIDQDAATGYARLLTPKGTFAMNVITTYYTGRPTLGYELLETFGSRFASVGLYPTDPYYPRREEQNYLLIASHDPNPNLDYLQSTPVRDSA